MTKDKLQETLNRLKPAAARTRKAKEALHDELRMLDSPQCVYNPREVARRKRETRTTLQERLKPDLALAKAAAALAAQVNPADARAAYLRAARLVPGPDAEIERIRREDRGIVLDSDAALMRQNALILNELRALNMREELRTVPSEELGELAKIAAATGSESGVATAVMIHRELMGRADPVGDDHVSKDRLTKLQVARKQVADALDGVELPPADVEVQQLAEEIRTTAHAVESAYRELTDPTYVDRTEKIAKVRELGAVGYQEWIEEQNREEAARLQHLQAKHKAIMSEAEEIVREGKGV